MHYTVLIVLLILLFVGDASAGRPAAERFAVAKKAATAHKRRALP